jgi:hypothetical protein
VISTVVDARSVETGEPLVDRLTVGVAEGSRPWRTRADGSPVQLVAEGVLYGPFAEQPAQAQTVPASAPVRAMETVTITGPGEYATSGAATASEPGYYTWVWTIDAARQDAAAAASLPAGYVLASPFGLPDETHWVSAPPPRLAATGSTPTAAAAAGAALASGGTLLALASGILARRRRWALRE